MQKRKAEHSISYVPVFSVKYSASETCLFTVPEKENKLCLDFLGVAGFRKHASSNSIAIQSLFSLLHMAALTPAFFISYNVVIYHHPVSQNSQSLHDASLPVLLQSCGQDQENPGPFKNK